MILLWLLVSDDGVDRPEFDFDVALLAVREGLRLGVSAERSDVLDLDWRTDRLWRGGRGLRSFFDVDFTGLIVLLGFLSWERLRPSDGAEGGDSFLLFAGLKVVLPNTSMSWDFFVAICVQWERA